MVSLERALKGKVDRVGLGLGLGLGVWAEVAGPNFLGFLMGLEASSVYTSRECCATQAIYRWKAHEKLSQIGY